jgi:hypothetical protein
LPGLRLTGGPWAGQNGVIGVEQWQLARLITWRTEVQFLPPVLPIGPECQGYPVRPLAHHLDRSAQRFSLG